eukprot:9489828-Ditylum_brightwellii.AAC.1
MFEHNDIISPDILINVHPTLVQKLREHKSNYKPDEAAPIPDFKFTTYEAKWGSGTTRVETTVLKFLCTEQGRLYLKSLMSHVWSTANIRGYTTAIAVDSIHPTVANKHIAVSSQRMTIKD